MPFSLREKKAKNQNGDHENLMNVVSIYFWQYLFVSVLWLVCTKLLAKYSRLENNSGILRWLSMGDFKSAEQEVEENLCGS